MLYIVTSTVFWILFFQSSGNSLLLFLRIRHENPFVSIWIGFFTISFLALTIAIFIPLGDTLSHIIIFLFALPGVPVTYKSWGTIFYNLERRMLFFYGLCFCCILVAQGIVSSYAPMGYDTDLYHQQAVRWLVEYGIVPGLGNLHFRLAQVSGWLALAAIMDWGPFQARTAYILPPLWLMGALLYFFYGACQANFLKKRIYFLCIFFLSIFYLFYLLSFVPSLYYDRPPLIVYCIVIGELLTILLENNNRNQCVSKLVLISILISESILFKPVSICIVLFFLLILLWYTFIKRVSYANIFLIIIIPCVVALLWLINNSILSGYPIFPCKMFPLSTDWVMPEVSVEGMRRGVQGWARWPSSGYQRALAQGLSYWFFPWLHRNIADKFFLCAVLIPFMAGGIFWAIVFFRKGNIGKKIFFFSLSLGNIVYWFFQHPAYRFGLEFFWTWLSLAIVFCVPAKCLIRSYLKKCAILALSLMVVVASYTCYKEFYKVQKNIYLLILPHIHNAFPGVTKHIIHPNSADEFIVFVPTSGNRCGNNILPCTPHISDNIFMRVPGDLGGGFRYK